MTDLHKDCRANEDALRQNTLDLLDEKDRTITALREALRRATTEGMNKPLLDDLRAVLTDSKPVADAERLDEDAKWASESYQDFLSEEQE